MKAINIEHTVIRIIADKLSLAPEDVSLESDLVKDFTADSLERVELLLALEEEFGIDIPESAAREITTVSSVVERIAAVIPPAHRAS